MSPARLVGLWTSADTEPGAAEAQVRRLRGRMPGGRSQARLTLVVLADGDLAEARAALAVVRGLGPRAPARTVVLVAGPGGPAGLGAEVTVWTDGGDPGRAASHEDVVVHLRGPAGEHMAAIVPAWTLPGVPVVVWFPCRLPAAEEQVAIAAAQLVVDSRRLGGRAPLAALAAAVGRPGPQVADLAWVRLHPWRLVVAGFFAGAGAPFLDDVRRIDVAGPRPAADLLAGWLAGGLGVGADAVGLRHADRFALRLAVGDGHRSGEVTVETVPRAAAHAALVTASVTGGPSHRRTVALCPQTLGADLDRMLSTPPAPDGPWLRALERAVVPVSRRRWRGP